MSAILELKETPQSCMECDIVQKLQTSSSVKFIFCGHAKNVVDVSGCINTRHPGCPLKITADNLRWIEKSVDCESLYYCPSCKKVYLRTYKHCPSCGIKLLPSEDK